MSYIVGVDIGGTFTDCVVLRSHADSSIPVEIKIGKASSTPPDFQTGFVEAMRVAASMHGVRLEEMLADAQVYHGCTVGTNALVEGKTAKVGVLATRGHVDAILMMKAGARLKWMPADYIAHVSKQTKPPPLVPLTLCQPIDERVAFDGNALVKLNETTARAAIRSLLAQKVEAIAISLIWSTANPAHEIRLREIVREEAPQLFVSISSEVSPRVGEYERTVATIINAMIGPPMRAYLEAVEVDLRSNGYRKSLQIMSCSGGLIDARQARELPVVTIGSGPVAGLIGAASLSNTAKVGDNLNVLTADVGGTTLDVGTIFGGTPVRRPTASHGQFEYFVPTLDVRSVGSGGGSIIHCDGHSLKVGPESAGARPGPVCFGRGGRRPTVTDAAAVLGYFNPEYFFGGRIKLDVAAAAQALQEVGAALGLSAEKTAAAALRIVDSQMADAIWLAVTQQGYDARDFTLYSFGGAGGLHATAMARELGISKVVVPLSNLAAGWSAFGIASSDALVAESGAMGLSSPFDPEPINARLRELETKVFEKLEQQGVARKGAQLSHFAEIRYSAQINQVRIEVPGGSYDAAAVRKMIEIFEREYERLYGKGSGYAAAGFQLTSLEVHGRAKLSELQIEALHAPEQNNAALKGKRDVIWYGRDATRQPTQVYDGLSLKMGSRTPGPAILEYPDTTIIVQHDTVATIHRTGSVVIEMGAGSAN